MGTFGSGAFCNDAAADWADCFGSYDYDHARAENMPSAVDGTQIIIATFESFLRHADDQHVVGVETLFAAATMLAQASGRVEDAIDGNYGASALAWVEQDEVSGYFSSTAHPQALQALELGAAGLTMLLTWSPDLADFHENREYMHSVWETRRHLHDAQQRLIML